MRTSFVILAIALTISVLLGPMTAIHDANSFQPISARYDYAFAHKATNTLTISARPVSSSQTRLAASTPTPTFDQSPSVSPSAGGTLTVSGRFRFCESDSATSNNCTQRDLRRARVELWDSGTTNRLITSASTGEDGSYSFPAVSNTDTDGTTLDVFVRAVIDGSIVQVVHTGGALYQFDTAVTNNVPDGSFNAGTFVIAGADRGSAGVFDTIVKGYDYALARGQNHNKVTVTWPAADGTYTAADGYTIHLVAGDEWDEDVILHEYTHSIQFQAFGQFIPGGGGNHQWDVCNAQSTNPQNFGFSEGFPDFFGVAINFETGYGDALYPKDNLYSDTVDFTFTSNLETGVPAAMGDCAEGSIAYILWDIFDSANDGRDTLSAGIGPVWNVFANYMVPATATTTAHHVYNINDFWDGWFARGYATTGQTSAQQIWGIYEDHGIHKDNTPPSSSVSALPTYTRTLPFVVSWSGTDDLSGIASYDVQYRDSTSGGAWTDWILGTTATSATFCAPCPSPYEGHTFEFRSRARDQVPTTPNLEAYPSVADARTTIDTTPPSSSVTALPAYSNPTFTVRWSGTDSTSGIASYDVQYRDATANGAWTNLITGTTSTSTSFAGTRLHTYEFQSRARDQAGNLEAYPTTADTSTTVPAILTGDFTSSPSQPQAYETITFTATSSGGGPPINYQWTFGDGYSTSPSTSTTATHYYTTAGTYGATLVVSSSEGQTITVTKTITVVAAFTAPIRYSPQYPHPGDTVTISADASGGVSPYRFNWYFYEDGYSTTGNPITRVYSAPVTSYAALNAYDSAGHTFAMIQPITITALLSADFSVNTTPQVGETATFTATVSGGVGPYSYYWTFGDGTSSTVNPATHAYSTTGTFTVALQVKSYDAESFTVTESVTVVPVLTSSFTYSPTSPISGQTVTFTATASGGLQPLQYQWNFGDSYTGTGSQVTHTYPVRGTYHVVLTTSDSSTHTVTSAQDVVVSPPPLIVSFTYSPSYPLIGQTVTFTASISGGVVPYASQWNFGDGTSGSGSTATHAYASSGTYTVTLTVTDATARTATSSQSIYVSCGCGGGGGSVAYGTLITMADGSKVAVQNLKVGDQMLGYDTTTGKFTVAVVQKIAVVDTSNMLVINTEAGIPVRVDANPAQTLWTKKSDGTIGWVPVTELKVGDYLFQETMGWVKITSIQFAPQGQHVMFDIVASAPYFASGYLDPYVK